MLSSDLLVLATLYKGDIHRQTNRRAVALSTLDVVDERAPAANWAFELDGKTARNILQGADTSTFDNDAQVAATLAWSIFESSAQVSNFAMDVASTVDGAGPEGNANPWMRDLTNSVVKMASTINGQIFNGLGPRDGYATQVAGLDVIDSTSNTYAGINRSNSSYSLVRGNVFGSTSTPLAPTIAQIRNDIATIKKASGEVPDLAFVDPFTFNTIAGVFDTATRYVIDTAAGKQVNLQGASRSINFEGCQFVEDKDAVSTTYDGYSAPNTLGSIYYVNTNYLKIKVLPPVEIPDEVRRAMRMTDGVNDIFGNIRYEALAKAGASVKARVEATLQLACYRPNALGVRRGVILSV